MLSRLSRLTKSLIGSSTAHESDEKRASAKGATPDGGADGTKSDATANRPDDHVAAVKHKSKSKRTTSSADRASRGDGHSSCSSFIESSATKRKLSELKQEKEAPVSKKTKSDIVTELSNGWTRGKFTYKKGSETRFTWISPGRKIEFKYSKDAMMFDTLLQTNGRDEVKAWIEVCNINYLYHSIQYKEFTHKQYFYCINHLAVHRDQIPQTGTKGGT